MGGSGWGHRGGPRLTWLLGAAALSTLIVLVSVLLGGHRRHDPSLDILDEGAHYAYVVALQHHHIPAWGDRVDQDTLRLEDCLLVVIPTSHDCRAHGRDPAQSAVRGYSFEAQQPPLGYLPHALTATPDRGPREGLAAARQGGIAWTVITGILLLALAWVERLPLLGVVLLQATCLFSPVFTHAAATVTNDASGVAAGALALLVTAVMRTERLPWPAFVAGVLAGLVIGLLKGVFIVAPAALVVAGLLLERPWTAVLSAWRDILARVSCVLGMLVGAAAAYMGWIAWQDARARVPSSVVLHALLGFRTTSYPRPDTILQGLQDEMSMLLPYFPDAPVHFLWNLSFVGAAVAMIVVAARFEVVRHARALALGTTSAMVLLAIGWPVLMYLQGPYDFHAEARYALPLLPILAIAFVRAVGRFGLVAMGVVLPTAAAAWQLVEGTF